MVYGISLLQDRVLFVIDCPTMQFHRAISEFKQIPLKEEVNEKILCTNAKNLLGN